MLTYTEERIKKIKARFQTLKPTQIEWELLSLLEELVRKIENGDFNGE